MKFNNREKKLLDLLKTTKLSPSHDIDHSLNTAYYAEFLSNKYKGDRDIVIAASLLHDLGRVHKEYKGKESAMKGAEMAEEFLAKANYLKDEIKKVCVVISEHDQPELHSDNINSRILKDADFIDGFGARGILRVGIHTGETGGNINDALTRLERKARERINGLEFLESKRIAWKLRKFTELFFEELESKQNLSQTEYQGKLIILEGISGSGKDTQATLLESYLNKKKFKTKLIKYPTEEMRKIWHQWRMVTNNPESELQLMLADMINTTNKEVLPVLKLGEIVIYIRSSISSQVYQNSNDDFHFNKHAFKFEPLADLIIYLDVDPKKAFERAKKEESFFGHVQIKESELYEKALSGYPNVIKINANKPAENVHNEIVTKLNSYLDNDI